MSRKEKSFNSSLMQLMIVMEELRQQNEKIYEKAKDSCRIEIQEWGVETIIEKVYKIRNNIER